jgi:uncharacterized protein YjbI with pentapeptide repeats
MKQCSIEKIMICIGIFSYSYGFIFPVDTIREHWDKSWNDTTEERRSRYKGTHEPTDLERFGKTGQCRHCNLQGLDLRPYIAKLKKMGLAIDLEYSCLNGAILSNCDLTGANLRKVGAWYVDFCNSNISRANAEGMIACGSNFNGARLVHTNLKNACLESTYLYQAVLHYAQLNKACIGSIITADRSSFYQANCTGSNFTGSVLVGASFVNANVLQARFHEITVDSRTNFSDVSNVRRQTFLGAKNIDYVSADS